MVRSNRFVNKLRERPIALCYLATAKIRDQRQDLIACLDRLRIEFERTLRGDQVDQLLHRFDVRGFEHPLANGPDTLGIGRNQGYLTGGFRGSVEVFAQLQQAFRVNERSELDLAHLLRVWLTWRRNEHTSIRRHAN